MSAFPRFDPYALLAETESRSRGGAPANPANPAKAEGAEARTLAALATLAATAPELENPYSSEAETEPATLLGPCFGEAPAEREPPYDEPCPARRGVIRHPQGRFEHFCAVCGAWGAWGFDVATGKPGRWFCFRHREGA